MQGTPTVYAFRRSTLSLALAMALSGTVQAQQAPGIGDAVRQAQPPALPAAQQPALPKLGNVPTEAPMQKLPGGGQEVLVSQFSVAGNRVIDSATLLALVQQEQGQRLSLAQLDEIATRITRHYRTHGYFVARAYIPAQEVTGGVLTIRVVEGNYGKFILNNHSLVQDSTVQGLLDDIKDRDIVSLDTLERAMLIINDTPGVKVIRADVMPGVAVGTSDFAIGTAPTEAYGGYALLDNDGSVYTGKQRLSFNANSNSPSARGDRLSASGMVTRHSAILNGRLAYSMLAGTDGTRAEATLSRTTYELGGFYTPLHATGTANSAELGASRPLKRTRNDSIDASVNLAYKDLTDKVSAVNTEVAKQATSISATIAERREHALFGQDGLSQGSASLTWGRLHFKNAVAAALDAGGADSQGSYAKLNVSAVRVSLLPAQFTLTASLRAQFSLGNKSLDGVERMSVSGSNGVAAYPTGELSGDHAALLHAELSRPLMAHDSVRLSANVFSNYGWAKQAWAPAALKDARELGDIGIGLSAHAHGALLKLQLAHRVTGGVPTSESVSSTRLLFQAGWFR